MADFPVATDRDEGVGGRPLRPPDVFPVSTVTGRRWRGEMSASDEEAGIV